MFIKAPPLKPAWRFREAFALLAVMLLFSRFRLPFLETAAENIFSLLPGGRTEMNELFVSAVFQTVFFLTGIIIFVFAVHRQRCYVLGLSLRDFGSNVRKGVASGFLLFFVMIFMSVVIEHFFPVEVPPQKVVEVMGQAESGWSLWVPFIVVSLLAPISEELYFRAFLYPVLRNKMGSVAGIIITSAVFAALHFDPVRFFMLFVAGCFLNLLYERSGSIYVSMIAHSVWNFIIAFFVVYLPHILTLVQ